MVGKIKKAKFITDSKELKELVQADLDLIELWKAFEKDAMAGITQINDGSISSIKLPSIFGYPDTVYHYNGILIFSARRGDVNLLLMVGIV